MQLALKFLWEPCRYQPPQMQSEFFCLAFPGFPESHFRVGNVPLKKKEMDGNVQMTQYSTLRFLLFKSPLLPAPTKILEPAGNRSLQSKL